MVIVPMISRPLASRAVEASTSTVCPTSAEAWIAWLDFRLPFIETKLLLRSSMPCSVLNCASCATKAVLSWGVSGLWFSSCVISSVRKSACPSAVFSFFSGSFLNDSAS